MNTFEIVINIYVLCLQIYITEKKTELLLQAERETSMPLDPNKLPYTKLNKHLTQSQLQNCVES